MPPTYHAAQVPFSFLMPNVSGNGQHKLNHQMFSQQNVDDALPDQRLSSQQQKVVLYIILIQGLTYFKFELRMAFHCHVYANNTGICVTVAVCY